MWLAKGSGCEPKTLVNVDFTAGNYLACRRTCQMLHKVARMHSGEVTFLPNGVAGLTRSLNINSVSAQPVVDCRILGARFGAEATSWGDAEIGLERVAVLVTLLRVGADFEQFQHERRSVCLRSDVQRRVAEPVCTIRIGAVREQQIESRLVRIH